MEETASQTGMILYSALAALLLPLLSFLILTFVAKKLPRKGDWLSLACSFLSFLASLYVFFRVFDLNNVRQAFTFEVPWVQVGRLHIDISLYLDNISAIMLLLVSFIALLVHIYSLSYMKGDARYHKYWPYLSLFVFAMLGLVLSGNLLITYMCWELVGLASYLMIGFWFEREKAIQANKKAFLINRIGDIGFLIALMALFSWKGTFDIQELITDLPKMPSTLMYIAGGGIILGAFAKSAQFPLHSWLPDAMEGPTAISSLIHAATMVAAGVFLLCRMYPIFPDELLTFVAVIGCFTAFMAASTALVQTDIKRVLAYSTISQLGYMMMGIGIGTFQGAMFHLVIHAFFKCLLFLCAGSIIHQIQHIKHQQNLDIDEQDMRVMGGLRKNMPFTFWTYSFAAAALIGLPLFSGFLSKEIILLQSFAWAGEKGGFWHLVPLTAVFTALLTAYYVTRQWGLVFLGKSRTSGLELVKESGTTMKIPMLVLALFTVFIWFSFNPFSVNNIPIMQSLSGGIVLSSAWIGWALLAFSLLLIPLVIYFTAKKFGKEAAGNIAEETTGIRAFLLNGWYFDNLYDFVFVQPVLKLAFFIRWFDANVIDGLVNAMGYLGKILAIISAWFDKYIVDGLVNFIAARARALGDFFRGFQTGKVQQYFAFSVLGLMVLYLITLLIG